MLNQKKLLSVVVLLLLITSVIACGATEVKQVSGERQKITKDFMKMMDEDQELKRLMEESISLAAVNNPDKKTNPVRSLDEYYDFLDWSATCMPWNILDGQDNTDLYRSIDQSLDYFYYLLDQPLPELAGKGYYYPCLEYHEPIATWCKQYASEWGEFLSTKESWNDEYYKLACKDEAFGMSKGWYADTNIWGSFNEWFSRYLVDESKRPISDADIVSPADSTPQGIWKIDENSQIDMGVQLKSSKFYSIEQIIGKDSEYETCFANGTMTHTFLDVNDYHRYHFPISGTILEVRKIPGLDAVGGLVAWSKEENKYVLYDENPGWQSIETRDCLIMDTEYGLVAILPIAMSQVSSCNWEDSVQAGAVVEKGDPMGYFLFGGSDIVMIFQDGVSLELLSKEHILMGEPYADVTIVKADQQDNVQDNVIQFPDTTADENVRTTLSREGYTLEQAVVLSRHNIRAPLSGAGSALDTITPHEWFNWSAQTSQLSVRGGTLETEMGQYFRKWLEAEGLFEPNYQPLDGAVRIYANSKQRTIATAQFFKAGLLPVYNMDIEYHCDFDTMDPTFNPVFNYLSDDYVKAAEEEIHKTYDPVIESLADNYALLEEVIDAKDSEDYKNGSFAGFVTGDSEFTFEEGKEPGVAGSLKKACQISDALVLQYYEEVDKKKAAFGHDLSDKEWEVVSEIKDVYGDVLFTAPLVSVNVAHPLLVEMEKELQTEGRQFTFLCGHDSNLASVMSALEVEDYSLPFTIEKKTPIGAKLVISRWKDSSGQDLITLDLVYQTTDQLRDMSIPGTDNPPGIYSLRLKGLNADANGMYKTKDVLERFNEAIGAYDSLMEEYEQDEAA